VHARRELVSVTGQPGQRERLDAERQIHHLRRVTFGRDEVHHPSFGEQQQGPAVAEVIGVDVRPHVTVNLGREPGQRPHVDLGVEVPRVGQDGAVAHHRDVRRADHVTRSGRSDEHLAERRGLRHRQHAEAAQRRVEGADRIDLRDDHLGAEPAGAFGHAPAAGPEPRHHHRLARQQRVGGPQDAVDGRLPGPAGVVHHALDRRVVGRDDRERERALGGHPAQPDHAGRGRLASAPYLLQQGRRPRVQRVHQVAAVVDDQVGRPGAVEPQGQLDVAVVAGPVHPGPGEDRDPVPDGERRGDVVLGGQRVGGGQADRRPARAQQPQQHRRLGRDVQARRDGQPVKGPLVGEPPDEAGHERHGPLGVADADVAVGGKPGVGDVPAQRGAGGVGAGGVSNGSAPACTGRRRGRRCSPPDPWSAR
jgi:hypothetical protein